MSTLQFTCKLIVIVIQISSVTSTSPATSAPLVTSAARTTIKLHTYYSSYIDLRKRGIATKIETCTSRALERKKFISQNLNFTHR